MLLAEASPLASARQFEEGRDKLQRQKGVAHPILVELFDRMDANKDGLISKGEFANAFTGQYRAKYEHLLGAIGLEWQSVFASLDDDCNDVIDFEEFVAGCSSTQRKTGESIDEGVRQIVTQPRVVPAVSDVLEGVETGDSSDELVMDRMVMRAQKKFDKLDANGNGVLEGDELLGLAEWVWSSFHPGGVALTADEQQAESAKLLGRLDTNGDGCMSFVEFGAWFKRTCSSIERYRRGLAQGKPQQVPKGA